MFKHASFITPEGLQVLKNWKYRAGQYTYCDNMMQPFWNWFVTLFPIWVAPNLITLSGLVFSLITVAMYAPWDGNNTMTFPLYTYYIGAFNLMLY